MEGFDPKFEDPPDYILAMTKEIWEDRGIETLRHYYTPDIPVRSPSGIVIGNEAVIAATMATLAEFPDRTLFGEDVIWSDDGAGGFLSSHRILTTATHTGTGTFGTATGTSFTYRVIADCAARGNQIYDEWLIRDQGAIVAQLGTTPRQFAADQIEAEGGPGTAAPAFTPAIDVAGPYTGTGNENEFGTRYESILRDVMAGAMGVVPAQYDRGVHLELPSGQQGHSWDAADRFWLGLRSSFPNATFTVHHRIGRDDPMLSPRAALRWSLHGTHGGWGTFGKPTGADVYVMGISHAEFGPRGLRREWVLLDETAVWKQILMHLG